ncbi:magnesium/cobalt transporter CorA [Nitrosomonas sp. Is37]|uniref:magnesium/cobalt transporter CorA n=1 Tax=Nitrosomonas sp. Is37 TaxID=3080535 RepID=UPI00294AF6BD|nr:magnesium/cobalt transporter CorA [Nitrosomonas sp. Is37]MDV6343380.1 magnesium/cobalt transporter CorA [Nitrosomonas sp. Is37]
MYKSRATRRRTKKIGLPAETLLYTGEREKNSINITLIDYDAQSFEEHTLKRIDECLPYKRKSTVTWINIDGVHDPVMLEKLGEGFGIHRLVTEDLMNIVQRPKCEDFGDYLFIVLKMLSYDEKENRIIPEQISIILGQKFLLSFQEDSRKDVFHLIRDHLPNGKGKMRKMDTDYLAYALLDTLVDNYFIILEKLGDRIDLLEEELMIRPGKNVIEQLYQLKRELLFLHKAVWPLREVISSLSRRESPLIHEVTTPYLLDVYDHVVQAIDSVEIYRDMLTTMLDLYISNVSYRTNEIMKVLTIIATIFMPLTFLAGVYGMNFKYMPELDWEYGYLLVWMIMIGVGAVMLVYFKKKRWL